MCAAYKAGVGKRIAHSHATEENRVMGKLKKLPETYIMQSCAPLSENMRPILSDAVKKPESICAESGCLASAAQYCRIM